jgi:hypothetical protein
LIRGKEVGRDFELWILNSGFWILDYECLIMEEKIQKNKKIKDENKVGWR